MVVVDECCDSVVAVVTGLTMPVGAVGVVFVEVVLDDPELPEAPVLSPGLGLVVVGSVLGRFGM